MAVTEGFRSLDFIGGSSVVVPEGTCRGCYMNEHESELPDLLAPVFDDGLITVRQDAEWAVPGFMIVGLRPHIGAIDQMPLSFAYRLTTIIYHVRRAMREELDLHAVQTYQEEKLSLAHYHVWMLPLWPRVMKHRGINPRIYESNLAEYLRMFDIREYGGAVRECAQRVRNYFVTNSGQIGPPPLTAEDPQ